MSEDWKMTINLSGRDFACLKYVAENVMRQIVQAKTYKQLPIAMAGGSGNSGNDYSYSVAYSCPVEQRIANLRAEADALEKGLGTQ